MFYYHCFHIKTNRSRFIHNIYYNYINNIIVNLVPNPANNFIDIEKNIKEIGIYLLSISDMRGREILTKNIQFVDKYKLDIADIKNGIYFLKLQNDKEIAIRKIVVQH